MNLFYNKEGIGDTLLISLTTESLKEWKHENKENVTRIIHPETEETIGFNVFDASQYLKVDGNGPITYDEAMVEELNILLKKVGFSETLQFNNEPDFVVGIVKSKEKHPNADKLSICQVDVGSTELQIVCGAPNVAEGQKVVVACVGAYMPSGTIIKDAELRGVASSGMICSARELDLPNAPQGKGILVLEDSRKVGEDFFNQS